MGLLDIATHSSRWLRSGQIESSRMLYRRQRDRMRDALELLEYTCLRTLGRVPTSVLGSGRRIGGS